MITFKSNAKFTTQDEADGKTRMAMSILGRIGFDCTGAREADGGGGPMMDWSFPDSQYKQPYRVALKEWLDVEGFWEQFEETTSTSKTVDSSKEDLKQEKDKGKGKEQETKQDKGKGKEDEKQEHDLRQEKGKGKGKEKGKEQEKNQEPEQKQKKERGKEKEEEEPKQAPTSKKWFAVQEFFKRFGELDLKVVAGPQSEVRLEVQGQNQNQGQDQDQDRDREQEQNQETEQEQKPDLELELELEQDMDDGSPWKNFGTSLRR